MEVEAKYDLNRVEDYEFWHGFLKSGKEIGPWQVIKGSKSTIPMLAIYLDTAEEDFSKNLISFRLRQEGENLRINLKRDLHRSGALSERSEWEYRLDGDFAQAVGIKGIIKQLPDYLSLKAGDDEELAELLAPVRGKKIIEMGRIDFTRELRDYVKLPTEAKAIVNLENCPRVEWSIDYGSFLAKDNQVDFREMEFELKNGEVEDLEDLIARLKEQHAMLPQNLSKRARLHNLQS